MLIIGNLDKQKSLIIYNLINEIIYNTINKHCCHFGYCLSKILHMYVTVCMCSLYFHTT